MGNMVKKNLRNSSFSKKDRLTSEKLRFTSKDKSLTRKIDGQIRGGNYRKIKAPNYNQGFRSPETKIAPAVVLKSPSNPENALRISTIRLSGNRS